MVLNVHKNLIRDEEKEAKEGMEHRSKKVNMVLYVHRNLIRDGDKGGSGDMEVGKEGDYMPITTLSPPE